MMMQSSSSWRNCSVSTFCVASGTCRRSWPNRKVSCLRALTTIGFHLPSMTSMVALTGHSESNISNPSYKIVPTGRGSWFM